MLAWHIRIYNNFEGEIEIATPRTPIGIMRPFE